MEADQREDNAPARCQPQQRWYGELETGHEERGQLHQLDQEWLDRGVREDFRREELGHERGRA